PLGGRGPRVDDVVVEVLDVRGHELSRDEGGLGELEGQAEAGEALDDLRDLLLAAVPLMHVGLEAEGIDLHARLEAFLDDLLEGRREVEVVEQDRKSTRLNSSHVSISYAVFCLKKKMMQKKK